MATTADHPDLATEPVMLTRLVLDDVLRYEHIDIKLGKITSITGGNDRLKTTILLALRNFIEGGNDPSIVRNGAQAAIMAMEFSNGEKFRKRTPAEGKPSLIGRDATGEEIKPAQARIRELLDSFAVNPHKFIHADTKTRLQLFFQACPITVTAADIKQAVGETIASIDPQACEGANGLAVIEGFHDSLYEHRTAINRVAKEKANTVKQLRESLPTTDNAVIATESATAYEELAKVNQELAMLDARADAELQKYKQSLKDTALAQVNARKEKDAAEIGEIEKQIQALRDKISSVRQAQELYLTQQRADLLAAEAAADRKADEIKQQHAADQRKRREELIQTTTRLDAAIEAHQRAEGTRQVIAEMEESHRKFEAESKSLTTALGNLETLKEKLLGQIPIKGLKIQGGEIWYANRGDEHVVFDRLNTATQVKVLVGLARLRIERLGKDCPLVVLDGLECLDPDTLEGLKRYCSSQGLQVIYARVTSGELKIEAA